MALGVSELDITDVNIVNGLQNARLAGRMQIIAQSPTVIVDVAHNPHSAHYLANHLRRYYAGKIIHCVIGMLKDKDIKATIGELEGVVSHWYPCSLPGVRGASASQLCECINETQEKEYTSATSAYLQALNTAKEEEMIIVVGSFVTVAEILGYIQNK